MKLLSSLLLGLIGLVSIATAQAPGTVGGPGLAILARKALIAELNGRSVVNNAVLLVREGKLEALGEASELEVPSGYEVLDLGDLWVAPGMIDLHNHVAGGLRDLNDMVYLTNPGIRSSSTIQPGNRAMKKALAGGVTSVLLIPGSGTNMGGQGVLVRGGFETYAENLIRDPGSLKLAQAGNPERYLFRVGRSFMNYNTRNTFKRGVAYAKTWEAYEQGQGPKPDKDLQFEVFRDLRKRKTQVSTHTQLYQVVNMTIDMVAGEMGLPVYIDHGTFDSHKAAARADAHGVNAILGPRQITTGMRIPGFAEYDQDGAVFGVAAKYQEAGHSMIGFNTDAPVVPQEELSVQAAMAVRYGFKNDHMQAVRGLTIVPATTAGIGGAIGSLEVGKDADLIIVTGDPVDPRTSIEMVFQRGHKVYDTREDARRW
jgi:imidazolonepropionase-like amidohydrolase